jgi:hypothetical protein
MFVARPLANRAQHRAVTSDDSYRGRLYRLLIIPMLMPLLLVTCGSVLQGPVFGSITLKRQSDAGDAVAFLRCRGAGIHGETQTDAENVRVDADGDFSFAGSLTFPTTDTCWIPGCG